jgi:hypothetical protein
MRGHSEARRILENLARNGPPTARVASIKVLLGLDKAAAAEAELEPTEFERAGLLRRRVFNNARRQDEGKRGAAWTATSGGFITFLNRPIGG